MITMETFKREYTMFSPAKYVIEVLKSDSTTGARQLCKPIQVGKQHNQAKETKCNKGRFCIFSQMNRL